MAINATYYLDGANLSVATAVYLDAGLINVAPDGFYRNGTVVRQQSTGILLAPATCEDCAKPALRSFESTSTPDLVDMCIKELTVPVYIVTASEDVIVSGDIVCNSDDVLDTFDGGGLYYKLSLDSAPAGYEYVCQISSVGVVNVYILCV